MQAVPSSVVRLRCEFNAGAAAHFSGGAEDFDLIDAAGVSLAAWAIRVACLVWTPQLGPGGKRPDVAIQNIECSVTSTSRQSPWALRADALNGSATPGACPVPRIRPANKRESLTPETEACNAWLATFRRKKQRSELPFSHFQL